MADIVIKRHDTKGKFIDTLKLNGSPIVLVGCAVSFILKKTGLVIKQTAVIIDTSAIVNGSLVARRRYKIVTFVAGDDFTNVGAASNASGVIFVATGDAPATWTNGSTLEATPGQVEYQPIAQDVAVKGKYRQEWEVIFVDTEKITCPNGEWNNVTILEDLDNA